jgi:hypothetical protein
MTTVDDPVVSEVVSKKRRRPAKSCEQCRQRKVRCDLDEPCGPCTRARAGLSCTYSPETIRGSGVNGNESLHVAKTTRTNRTQRTAKTSSTSGNPVENSSSSFGACQPRQQSTPAVATPASVQQGPASHIQRLLSGTLEPSTPGASLGIPFGNDGDVGSSLPRTSEAPKESHSKLSVPSPAACLRVTPEKTRIFNQMHWSQTAARVGHCATTRVTSC